MRFCELRGRNLAVWVMLSGFAIIFSGFVAGSEPAQTAEAKGPVGNSKTLAAPEPTPGIRSSSQRRKKPGQSLAEVRRPDKSTQRTFRKPLRVGIHLGGKPTEGPEEIARAEEVARRILKIALEDFRRVHGRSPHGPEELLRGNPPILKALPQDPKHPGTPIPMPISKTETETGTVSTPGR